MSHGVQSSVTDVWTLAMGAQGKPVTWSRGKVYSMAAPPQKRTLEQGFE